MHSVQSMKACVFYPCQNPDHQTRSLEAFRVWVRAQIIRDFWSPPCYCHCRHFCNQACHSLPCLCVILRFLWALAFEGFASAVRPNECRLSRETRKSLSNTTPSLASKARLRCTFAEASPISPPNPPSFRSALITRCHGMAEQANGFDRIAWPTERAHPTDSAAATAP